MTAKERAADLLQTMQRLAPGFYTERDGGDWYIVTPDHGDRLGEGFVHRDDARRLVIWLAGGSTQPQGWTLAPHGSGELCYDLDTAEQYAQATVWTRTARQYFPKAWSEVDGQQ